MTWIILLTLSTSFTRDTQRCKSHVYNPISHAHMSTYGATQPMLVKKVCLSRVFWRAMRQLRTACITRASNTKAQSRVLSSAVYYIFICAGTVIHGVEYWQKFRWKIHSVLDDVGHSFNNSAHKIHSLAFKKCLLQTIILIILRTYCKSVGTLRATDIFFSRPYMISIVTMDCQQRVTTL